MHSPNLQYDANERAWLDLAGRQWLCHDELVKHIPHRKLDGATIRIVRGDKAPALDVARTYVKVMSYGGGMFTFKLATGRHVKTRVFVTLKYFLKTGGFAWIERISKSTES